MQKSQLTTTGWNLTVPSAFKDDITEADLKVAKVFALAQTNLMKPTYFRRDKLVNRGVSYARTVFPDGKCIVHLGKGDSKYDSRRNGGSKVFTRGLLVSDDDVQPVAVLRATAKNKKQAEAIKKEDQKGNVYDSEYVIQPIAQPLERQKKDEDRLYLFHPLAEMDAFQFAEERRTSKEGFRVVRDVAKGLATIHSKGDVHRDVKPENILVDLTEDGKEVKQARLTDLGFCKSTKEVRNAWDQRALRAGTPGYMPEETEYRQQLPSDDIYALGVVLETLHERCDGTMTKEQNKDYQALLQEMKASDPSGTERPTAKQVADRLDALIQTFEAPKKRHWAVLIGVIGLLFLAALGSAGGGVGLWQSHLV